MRLPVLIATVAVLFPATDMQAQTASGKKVLVAYFSHSGNTREMARQIAEATNGDLFEIVPQSAYPAQYDAVMAQAKREIGRGYRPALKGRLPDIGAYDVIFVGSPCWWGTVAPFMTHGGSRMGRSEEDIGKLCHGATLLGGLPVRGSAVKGSLDAVGKWIGGMNLSK